MSTCRWILDVKAAADDSVQKERADALPCIRLLPSGAFLKKLTEVRPPFHCQEDLTDADDTFTI